MPPALVEAVHAFGLSPLVADNVCYLDEQNVVYPAGSTVVIYNTDQHTQRFIHATEGCDGISAMAVSPNRRYVALAERGAQATVTIYDLHSLKKRKVHLPCRPAHTTLGSLQLTGLGLPASLCAMACWVVRAWPLPAPCSRREPMQRVRLPRV
jgi:hypothetical protein